MSTQTLDRTEETLQTGNPTLAHIVAPENGKEGAVICMEARFNGTEVTALCGHLLVPSRDPRSVPSCERCIEIFEGKFGPDGQPSEA